FGPITLGIHDLEVGQAKLDGSLTFDGYHGGVLSPNACGSLTLGGQVDVVDGSATVDVCAALDPAAQTLGLTGDFNVSAKLGDAVELDGAQLDFSLGLAFAH